MNQLNKKFYNKKIPANPKFQNVKPIVMTGKTMQMVQILADHQISRRIQETYCRISAKALHDLLVNDKKDETGLDLSVEKEYSKFIN